MVFEFFDVIIYPHKNTYFFAIIFQGIDILNLCLHQTVCNNMPYELI